MKDFFHLKRDQMRKQGNKTADASLTTPSRRISMVFRRILLAVTSISFILLSCDAEVEEKTQINNVEDLAAAIQKSMSETASIYAPFKQIKTLKELPFPLESTGQILIQLPEAVRFEFLEPFKSITIRTKDGIAKYEKHEEWTKLNSGESRMMDVFFTQLFNWFSGDFESSRNIFEPLLTTEDSYLLLNLISQPKRLRKYIDRIEIQINPYTYAFESICIYAANGDQSSMIFESVHLNIKMDRELFDISLVKPVSFQQVTPH